MPLGTDTETDPLDLAVAYSAIADHVQSAGSGSQPQDVYGAASAWEPERLAALLFALGFGDDLVQAAVLADRVMELARDGRRPIVCPALGVLCALEHRTEPWQPSDR